MSALNWATIAMSVVAIALSIDSIRINRQTSRRKQEHRPCCKGGPQWGHDWNCPKLP